MYLMILFFLILCMLVGACFRKTNQANDNVNGTINLQQNNENMINDVGKSRVFNDSVCKRTEYQIVNMVEESIQICIMKESDINIEW